jgi:hypothetical protein
MYVYLVCPSDLDVRLIAAFPLLLEQYKVTDLTSANKDNSLPNKSQIKGSQSCVNGRALYASGLLYPVTLGPDRAANFVNRGWSIYYI